MVISILLWGCSLFHLVESSIRVQFIALALDRCYERKIGFLRLLEGVPSPMFPIKSEYNVPVSNGDMNGHSRYLLRAQRM
jgi:hypothetical protein